MIPESRPGRGLADFGEGRHRRAFDRLLSAQSHIAAATQRDVFERVTVDAGIHAGRLAEVEAILADRVALRAGHADAFAESRHGISTREPAAVSGHSHARQERRLVAKAAGFDHAA